MSIFQNLPATLNEVDFFNMVSHLIERIDRKEESFDGFYHMNSIQIHFKNRYILSVIIGSCTYGGDQGLFEIGPICPENGLDGSLLDLGDDVLGYLTSEEVWQYVIKMANKKFIPKQIESP